MSDDLAAILLAAASQPQSATIDGNSATARPIPDLIALDRYVKSQTAARSASGGLGVIMRKTAFPGAAD